MLSQQRPIENLSAIVVMKPMQTEEAGSTYKKSRVEAVSDGIFTIAMTLLVLNLKPAGRLHTRPRLVSAQPTMAAVAELCAHLRPYRALLGASA
jgi:uncharacterized membrane protein